MKPVYLEFNGINSFTETAKVDFEKLLAFGIFGIFGDTGSGKSTILDAIAFSLYGNVLRSRSGSIADIINYKADKAFANFEFEIYFEGARRTFRVERELKRKNATQKAQVFERKEGELFALSDGVRESNSLLERIIGLEQRDFEKCIALPQGEFAQFVKSARGDRLKLVSRLFDLERYGEGLIKRANARLARARAQVEITHTRLEPFTHLSKENNDKLQVEILENERVYSSVKEELEKLRAEEGTLSRLLEQKREREKLLGKLQEKEAISAQMEELERGLSRLNLAQIAIEREKELEGAQTSLKESVLHVEEAEKCLQEAQDTLKEAELWQENEADEEITRLSELRVRAQTYESEQKRAQDLENKLKTARQEYVNEAKCFANFDYLQEREAIEAQLLEIGNYDFATYLEKQGKESLFREEYARFAQILRDLSQKYPQIEQDTLLFIQRYARLSQGEQVAFATLRARFEAQDKRRKELERNRLLLEERNGSYKAHCTRLQQLQTEGLHYKEELNELRARIGETLPPVLEIQAQIERKKLEKTQKSALKQQAQRAYFEAQTALATRAERQKNDEDRCKIAAQKAKEALLNGEFTSVAQASDLIARYGDASEASEKVRAYREEKTAICARLAALPTQEVLSKVTEEGLSLLKNKLCALEDAAMQNAQMLALKRDELQKNIINLQTKLQFEQELTLSQKEEEVCERLKKLLEGNKFMEYAAEEYLQTVTQNAGVRLLSLTDGRYFLRYDSGFFVGDNLAGGALRAVYTLSGGETFLVSLSLALSLSAEICARSLRPIEFFFLDEGFGTLDERLVDTVMDSLEKLKGEHFSIGIISHVEELKHRIEKKLLVKKATEKHGSQILTE